MRTPFAAAWIGLGSACGWSVTQDLILSTSGSTEGVATSSTSEPDTGSDEATSVETGATPDVGCTDRWGQPGWGFEAPVLLEGLNSELLEADPRLSADGLTLSFSSTRLGGAGGFDLYLATRAQPSGPFDAPVPLTSLNTPFDETALSWVSDGSVVFASTRSTADQWSTLWQAQLSPTVEISPLDALDLPDLNNFDPFVSADGLQLLWTAANSGTDDLNLRAAGRSALDDSFEALGGFSFESAAYDDSLTLSANGRIALWGSERTGGLGAHDLWFAVRATPEDEFGAPTLVPDLNSEFQDRESFVTADGCTVLFVSERPDGVGQWDLYSASVRLD
ncbi:MAG: hypothetical protein AAGF11_42635 [Myxococcota bacterium]